MPIKCINCGLADLESKLVRLAGQVRGEDYTVEMLGLECPQCGYKTIDGPAMPEYGRLLADRYRTAHGLLTSDDIRTRRERLEMSQQAFADFLGVGVASVKRWEMGKIQDPRNNALIIDKTTRPMLDRVVYTLSCTAADAPDSTMQFLLGAGVTVIHTATVEPNPGPNRIALMEQYFTNATKEPNYFCSECKQTGWASVILDLPDHQTVPPHIVWFSDHQKERRSHVRPH